MHCAQWNRILLSVSFLITTFSLLQILTLAKANSVYLVSRFDDEHSLQFDFDSGTPYKNCGGSRSVIKSVQLTPCDEISEGHCVLRRGINVTCSISFESEENSTTLTAKVFGIIGFVPVPFPCPQPNACENSGIECPMVKGHVYDYSLTAPILEKYPKKKLWVKGELKDDNDELVTCIELPIKIE
ncbi:Ecdysteroid-regulated 16 kDa protein [Pseudolycoriella hygida]|uniref:Ecdysteroid-regulated 16 kDa protein n=1 Tax=Pseudolycoriella hygida TaxID=35572 RepID=A0A9Q0NH40_9DIPT|nr:Ecdysteroid-regulated 16 kDa protein [Pseudolycoriella hygida]